MTTQPGAYQLTKVCIIVWILVLLALFSPISVNCEFWKFCGFCLPWEECTCVVAHFDCCGWFSGYCTYCFNVALHLKPFASNLLSYVLVPFACLAWTTHRDQIYRIVLSRISHQLDWNIYMYIHSLEMAHWSHHFPNQLYINFRNNCAFHRFLCTAWGRDFQHSATDERGHLCWLWRGGANLWYLTTITCNN